MENTVTNRQLFMIIIVVVMSCTVVDVSKIMTQSAGAGSWLTILLAMIVFAALALAIAKLNNMFPGKMIFDYGSLLIGKAGAYLAAVFITLYFIAVVATYDITLSNLLQTNFLPETPTWATVLAILPVLGYVAYKGISNTARLVEIYGVIFFIIGMAVQSIMLFQGDMNHILPLYDPSETARYIAALKDAVFPFLGFEVLLVIPFTAKNGKKAEKATILAIVFVGIFYIFNVLTCVMMIGENEILHYNFTLITAIRQVTLPQLKLFARIDLLYLTVGFLGFVGSMAFLYLSAVELICRMIPNLKRIFVVILVGAMAFLAELALRGINDINSILRNILTYMGLTVGGAIPLLLLAIAKVKKHAHKKAA